MPTTQKFYDANEIKEDAAERIKQDDASVTSYTYPIGIIWEGTERETVVTADITAEKIGPAESSDSRVFFEDPVSPPGEFVIGEHGDYGAQWMMDAQWVAQEMRIPNFARLLEQAGVKHDSVWLGGEHHLYFDPEEARKKVAPLLLEKYEEVFGDDDEFPDDPTFQELLDMPW